MHGYDSEHTYIGFVHVPPAQSGQSPGCGITSPNYQSDGSNEDNKARLIKLESTSVAAECQSDLTKSVTK